VSDSRTQDHAAAYAETLDEGKVRCHLCPHRCLLTEGKRGICLTRANHAGRLVTQNFCRPVSLAVDPIEKKPLYHFLPGSTIFSTGPNGCTMKCAFCQNCDISQQVRPVAYMGPARLLAEVMQSGSAGVAYTYSEPFIWFETIMAVGPRVRENGLANVMVTNGYMERGPLAELLGVVDAMNVDIKSMDPAFYRRLCKADLSPVLNACTQIKAAGCHLEITNLLIPGENDSAADVRRLASHVAGDLGRDTPLHLSRYFPRNRMRHGATPPASLLRAYDIASEYLDYVYLGNIQSDGKADTRCPECGAVLIKRDGYSVRFAGDFARPKATCPGCGAGTNVVTSLGNV
jgi:pyruvate formate lyase activating enzyme